ncbi:MAG TPA: exodeoxyribonuclease VII large subunit, partial [Chloroflexota bacterium]|nr:exodeoxyribonuclease VII large subunit [Chloroflexota bacterium]
MEIYDVSQVTFHLKNVIESDPTLVDLWVSGEISNFTLAQSGHAYFTLKDQRASLRCVLFRSQITRRTVLP